MDKQLAMVMISDRLAKAASLLRECEVLAEDSGVCFSLPWGGEGTHQRGMGARYVPTTASDEDKDWYARGYQYDGWMPSAGTC